jgi:hypothetical protein
LIILEKPDFEKQSSYNILLSVSDGESFKSDINTTITVMDLNEPVKFSSNKGELTATISTVENNPIIQDLDYIDDNITTFPSLH